MTDNHARAFILTDEPRDDGTTIDPAGVDWIAMQRDAYVHVGRVPGFNNIVGEIECVELARVHEDQPSPVGLRCRWKWLERPPPGRYEAHIFGVIIRRDMDGNAIESVGKGVSIFRARRDDTGIRTFEVKDEPAVAWKCDGCAGAHPFVDDPKDCEHNEGHCYREDDDADRRTHGATDVDTAEVEGHGAG